MRAPMDSETDSLNALYSMQVSLGCSTMQVTGITSILDKQASAMWDFY